MDYDAVISSSQLCGSVVEAIQRGVAEQARVKSLFPGFDFPHKHTVHFKSLQGAKKLKQLNKPVLTPTRATVQLGAGTLGSTRP